MKRFKDLAIKYKILFGYFFILAMFVALGGYYTYSTNAIKRASRNIELSNFAGLELISGAQLTLYRINHLTHDLSNLQEGPERQKYRKEIELYTRKFNQLLSEYKEVVKTEPDALKKVLAIETIFNKHHQGLTGEKEDIAFEQIGNNLEELHDKDTSNLSSALGSIDRLATATRDSYLWLILLSFSLSVIIACAIAKVIALPIKGLMIGMRKLANGSPDYKIQITSKDEVGSLQVGFINMAGRLKQSHSELEKQKGELEIRVKERTAELEKNQEYLKENVSNLEKARGELEKKIVELERFIKMAVDRELKMVELKQKIKELEERRPG